MSTGRVRIYDLARELHLENREILVICEQLNIPFKSHSSTITESEAAQIRAAARQQFANRPAPSSPGQSSAPSVNPASSNPPDLSPSDTPTEGRDSAPAMQKKQQILEIRKPKLRPNTEGAAPEATPPVSRPAPPKLVSPKRAEPARPEAAKSGTAKSEAAKSEAVKPEIVAPVNVPAQPSDSPAAPPAASVDLAPAEPSAPRRPAASGDRPAASATPEPIAEKKAELKTPPRPGTAPRPVKKPELVGPPSRPAKPAESKPAEPRAGAPSRPSRPTRPGEAKGPAAGGPGKGAPPTIVELRRPKPVRPTEATADGSADGTAAAPAAKLLEKPTRPASSGEDYENKLNRPTLNRPTKKGKDWEAEEEERARIAKDKAGKNKRRNQVEFEDEDDFEEDDELMMEGVDGQPAPFQVSLSIARPPKPKGVTPPKPAPQPKPVTKKGASRPPQRERREQQVKKERPELITLTEGLTVAELAEKLAVPETEVVKRLFLKGMAVSITQTLDVPTATMVAEELGVMVETAEKESEARKVTEMLDVADLESLQRRPPVVTIMGHVDHGKTTLLDSIRKTKVAQGEAGGITQHIGAYHVQVDQEGGSKKVVFLDTPGHEAFTAMRARGARVTDIAILVVAADDGVQPQTIEALSHARAAEVPIVVAINKIDKEGANPDRVKQELAERGLVPEEWGGDTIMVPVSALKGLYLDDLLENLLLVAEVEDLMANPDRLARGTVIEAHLDRARGPVATLLVQNGTLRVGDILLAGPALGKVRAMIDDRGHRVDAATPSFAVEVLGLSEVPAAGEEFEVFANEKDARAIASQRSDQQRQSRLQQAMASRRVSLTSISGQAQEGELKELNLVLKADVQGSLEAILGSLQQLPQNEVQVRVLLAAPGEISETDIDLAAASSAVVVGFNTTLAPGARRSADEAGIDVREYSVIYKLLDDIQAAMEGMLDPEEVEEPLGQAEVRGVFPVGRGTVAGCYVQSGKLIRDCLLRVRRGKELVFQGRMDSLKRFKEDTKEVNSGYECGVNSSGFNDWQMGDIIEAYRLVAKRRTLSL